MSSRFIRGLQPFLNVPKGLVGQRQRHPRLGKNYRAKVLRIEPLEIRTLLSGTPADLAWGSLSSPAGIASVQAEDIPNFVADDFSLTIVVNSDFVTIPENLGVAKDGSVASFYTLSDDGQVLFDPTGNATLGAFFQVWQNDAGEAGNNSDAVLSNTELMGYQTDYDHTLQMFVNGQPTTEYDQYIVQDDDAIVLVYGSDTVVSLNTTYGSIVLELFQEQTPGTVANFLNYVNDGDYINSIFHRSASNFVIQGGGYTTTSTTFVDTDQFIAVPADDPIVNEPGISNTRGTIAMAKLSGDPDSATSQFFINLGDNSFLDLEAYNSFTVFGQVLGMATVDEIAALPIDNSNNAPFGELPLGINNQLVVIESIEGNGDLTGVKYNDANGNSQYDDGELGISDVAIYADINGNGIRDEGEAYAITDSDGRYRLQVEPGAYTLRAEVSQEGGIHTVESLAATAEIGQESDGLDFGELDLPAPILERLQPEADTGIADDDNITAYNNTSSDTALVFLVSNVIENAEVRIYTDTILIGSTIATSDQVSVTTDGLTPLADVVHEITVTQLWNGFQSDPSTQLSVMVDSIAPAEITSTAPEYTTDGELFEYDVASMDEGSEGIVYSLAGAPTGMHIDATTGIIEWTAAETGGDYLVFQILLSDAAGNSVTQNVEMMVVGEIPAYPDQYAGDEDSIFDIVGSEGVLGNDGNSEAPKLTAELVKNPGHGELVFASDGSFTYTPADDFNGTDSFTYVAFDGDSYSNKAKVTLTIHSQPDPPTAVDDVYQAPNDGSPIYFTPMNNDSSLPDSEQALAIIEVTQGSEGGSVSISGSSIEYTAPVGFIGTETFSYIIEDSDGLADTATVTVEVYESSNNRLSGYVYLDTNFDGIRDNEEVGIPGVLITLTGIDNTGSVIERSLLTANSGMYEFFDIPAGEYQLVESQPAAFSDGLDTTTVTDATVADDQIANIVLSGSVVWTENNFGESALLPEYHSIVWFFASSADPQVVLRKMVAIAEENAGNAELAHQIRSNTPPEAMADTYETSINSMLAVDAAQGILANDSDIDSAVLEAILYSDPDHGAVLLDADGSFEYIPDSDYTGSDAFTYQASDGEELSNTETVSLTVVAAAGTVSEEDNDSGTATDPNDISDALPEHAMAADLVLKEVQVWLPVLL